MDFFIIFIIIFTIILILFFNDCISLPVLLSFPLLGIVHIFNKKTYIYGSTTSKISKITNFNNDIIPKRGANTEENKITELENENDKIIDIILKFDSITDDKKQDLKQFLNNFKLSNKYFMLKNYKNIIDPKILKYLFSTYTLKWENYIKEEGQIKQFSKKDENNIAHILKTLETANTNINNIEYKNIEEIHKLINSSLSINKSKNIFSQYLDYYNNYNFYKEHYNTNKYQTKMKMKQLQYIQKLTETIYNIDILNNIGQDNILNEYIYPNNTLTDIKNSIKSTDNEHSINSILTKLIKRIQSDDSINTVFTEINKRLYHLYILYHNNLNKIIKITTQKSLEKIIEKDNKFLNELQAHIQLRLTKSAEKQHKEKLQSSLNLINKLSTQNIEIPNFDKGYVLDNPPIEQAELDAYEEIADLEDKYYNNILTPLQEYSKICNELKDIIQEMIDIFINNVTKVNNKTKPISNTLYLAKNDDNNKSEETYNILINYINGEIKIDLDTFNKFNLTDIINFIDLQGIPNEFIKNKSNNVSFLSNMQLSYNYPYNTYRKIIFYLIIYLRQKLLQIEHDIIYTYIDKFKKIILILSDITKETITQQDLEVAQSKIKQLFQDIDCNIQDINTELNSKKEKYKKTFGKSYDEKNENDNTDNTDNTNNYISRQIYNKVIEELSKIHIEVKKSDETTQLTTSTKDLPNKQSVIDKEDDYSDERFESDETNNISQQTVNDDAKTLPILNVKSPSVSFGNDISGDEILPSETSSQYDTQTTSSQYAQQTSIQTVNDTTSILPTLNVRSQTPTPGSARKTSINQASKEDEERNIKSQLDDCNKLLQNNKDLLSSVNTLVKKIKGTRTKYNTSQLKDNINQIISTIENNDNEIDELILKLNTIKTSHNNIEYQIENIIKKNTKISIMTNNAIIKILVHYIQKMKECEEAKKKLEEQNKVLNKKKLSEDQLQQEIINTKQRKTETSKINKQLQDITDTNKEISNSEEQILKNEKELADLKNKIQPLQIKFQQTAEELKQKKVEISTLKKEIDILENELNGLNSQSYTNAIDQANQKNQTLQDEIKRLEKLKSKLQSDIQGKQTELSTSKAKETSLLDGNQGILDQIAQLELEQTKLKQVSDSITEEKIIVDKNLHITNKTREENSARLKELSEAKQSLEDELKQRQESINSMKEQIKENDKIITDLNEELPKLEKDITSLINHPTKKEYEDIEKELTKKRQEIITLLEKNDTDLTTYNQNKAIFDNDINDSKERIIAKQKELELLQKELADKLASKTQELKNKESELTEQQREYERITSQLENKTKELEDKTKELEVKIKKLEIEKTTLDAANLTLEATQTELKKYINEYFELYNNSNDNLINIFNNKLENNSKDPKTIKDNLNRIYERHTLLLKELQECKSLESTRLKELDILITQIQEKINNNKTKIVEFSLTDQNNTYTTKLYQLLDNLIKDRNEIILKNTELSTKNTELSKEIKRLTEQVKSNEKNYMDKIKQLNIDIKKLYNNNSITTSDNINSEIEAIHILIQKEKEKYEQKIAELTKELQVLQQKCNDEKIALEKIVKDNITSNSARILATDFISIGTTNVELKQKFNEDKQKYNIDYMAINDIESQLREIKNQLEKSKKDLKTCTEEKKQLEITVKELETKVTELQTSLKTNKSDYTKKLAELELEQQKQQNKVSNELKTELDNKYKLEMEELQKESKKLKAEIEQKINILKEQDGMSQEQDRMSQEQDRMSQEDSQLSEKLKELKKLEKTLNTLNDINIELNTELEACKETNDQLNKTIVKLEHKVRELQTSLETNKLEYDSKIRELDEKIRELETNNTDLSTKNSEQSEQIRTLKVDKDSLTQEYNAENNKLKIELDLLTDKTNKTENELKQQYNELSKLAQEGLNGKCADILKINIELNNKNKQLTNNYDELTKNNEQLTTKNEQLTKDYEQLKNERDELINKRNELIKEKDKITEEYQQQQLKIDTIQKYLENCKKELQACKKTNDQLNQTNEQLNKTNDQLNKTNDQLNKTNDQLNKTNEQLKIQIKDLTQKITELNTKIKTNKQSYEKVLVELKQQNLKYKVLNEFKTQLYNKYKSKIQEFQNESENLKNKIKQKINILKEQDRMSQEDSQLSEKRKELEELGKALNKLNDINTKLIDELNTCKETNDQLNQTNEQLKIQIEELTQNITELNTKIETNEQTYKKELVKLKQKNLKYKVLNESKTQLYNKYKSKMQEFQNESENLKTEIEQKINIFKEQSGMSQEDPQLLKKINELLNELDKINTKLTQDLQNCNLEKEGLNMTIADLESKLSKLELDYSKIQLELQEKDKSNINLNQIESELKDCRSQLHTCKENKEKLQTKSANELKIHNENKKLRGRLNQIESELKQCRNKIINNTNKQEEVHTASINKLETKVKKLQTSLETNKSQYKEALEQLNIEINKLKQKNQHNKVLNEFKTQLDNKYKLEMEELQKVSKELKKVLENEINRLKEQDRMSQEDSQLSEKLEKLDTALNKLNDINLKLIAELQACKISIVELEQKVKELQTSSQTNKLRYDSEIYQLEVKIRELETNNTDLSTKNSEQSEQIRKLKEDKDRLTQEYNAENKKLKTELDLLTEKTNNTEKELQQQYHELSQLTQEDLNGKCADILKINIILNTNYDKLTKDYGQLKNERDALKIERDELIKEKYKITQEYEKQQLKIDTIQKDLDDYRKELQACTNNLKTCNDNLTKSKDENNKLQNKIKQLEKIKSSDNSNIFRNLGQRFLNWTIPKNNTDQSRDINKLNTQIQELEKANKQLKQELAYAEDNNIIEEVYIPVYPTSIPTSASTKFQKNNKSTDIFRLPGDIPM